MCGVCEHICVFECQDGLGLWSLDLLWTSVPGTFSGQVGELRHGTGLGNRLSPPGDSGWSWGFKTFLTRSSGPAAFLRSSQGGGWGERMVASTSLIRERAWSPAASQPEAECQESFSGSFPL